MFEAMKDLLDTQRKVRIRHPLTLEQLLELLVERLDTDTLGVPELKKGLLGAAVVFPKVASITPRLTVKGTEVMIGQIKDDPGSASSAGGMPTEPGAQERSQTAGETVNQGAQYFKAVADAVTAALADQ